MSSMRPLGPKSSLLHHTFPTFYACYLLKSIQTQDSTAVYIGSTPSPPRRIRQHNGEIAAGARRTKSKRPWVMQMIVHGFPSRLAALKFEWAWQHPHKSRFMRDENGVMFPRGSRVLKKNILIVRTMLCKTPFDTWPLHVKLFTEDAVNGWEAAGKMKNSPPLPPGFTCSVELEGVNGMSGHPGSGRKGPISVDDSDFTSAILSKNAEVLSSGRSLNCSVCNQPIENYSTEPLNNTLCPSPNCTAVSHLHCLAQHFMKEQPEITTMIPRGGHCKSCGTYTLWGDLIRGCYRRLPPIDKSGLDPNITADDLYAPDDDEEATPVKKKRTSSRRASSKSIRASGRSSKAKQTTESSEGESFDFANIVSSSDSETKVTPLKRRPGRPPATSAATKPRSRTPSPSLKDSRIVKGKAKATTINTMLAIENHISNDNQDITPTKRRPGRPRIISVLTSDSLSDTGSESSTSTKRKSRKQRKTSIDSSSPSSSPKVTKRNKPKEPKTSLVKPAPKTLKKAASRKLTSSSEDEVINVENIASSSGSGSSVKAARKAGRPRRNQGLVGLQFPAAEITSLSSTSLSPVKSLTVPSEIRGASKVSKSVATKQNNRKGKTKAISSSSSEGEYFNFDNIVSSSDDSSAVTPAKRKSGRPPKSLAQSPPKPLKTQIQQKKGYHTTAVPLSNPTLSGNLGKPFCFARSETRHRPAQRVPVPVNPVHPLLKEILPSSQGANFARERVRSGSSSNVRLDACEDLDLAMSKMCLSNRLNEAPVKRHLKLAPEIIELSD